MKGPERITAHKFEIEQNDIKLRLECSPEGIDSSEAFVETWDEYEQVLEHMLQCPFVPSALQHRIRNGFDPDPDEGDLG